MKTKNANEQSGANRFVIPDGWRPAGPARNKTWRNTTYSADFHLQVKCLGNHDDWAWQALQISTDKTREGFASSRLAAFRKAELVAFRAANPIGEAL